MFGAYKSTIFTRFLEPKATPSQTYMKTPLQLGEKKADQKVGFSVRAFPAASSAGSHVNEHVDRQLRPLASLERSKI